ncbi:hypothetical protein [Xanthomonas vasicola]|uniref:hypothetical protein n=1 Tax=Xanthomonas vasicola TaxID=56459 RepID=UPI000530E423|nr:hypothetical protein [Xanthomonas vasicola]KGR44456.1 hypothetical protein NX04_06945 [Xanthomonas vasicola]TWQ40722.1 hypothetical protein FQJ96_06110 [Xanthomonas vasicola]TWQ61117.1 hypothetical protein FQJ93_03935 [Xanthomonas vasicola]TWQ71405.1 hypothetical protein FQJ89_22200 [Xanthomonas vasicola]
MDFASITTVVSSIKAAQELLSAAVGLRDANQAAAIVSKINEQLLAAQQGLLSHNVMLLQLQQENFETAKQLRELKEAIAKKDSYPLVDIGNGALAYTVDIQAGGQSDPEIARPQHHLCQICWDRDGLRSVLQPPPRFGGGVYRICNHCGKELFIGGGVPVDNAAPASGTVYYPLG